MKKRINYIVDKFSEKTIERSWDFLINSAEYRTREESRIIKRLKIVKSKIKEDKEKKEKLIKFILLKHESFLSLENLISLLEDIEKKLPQKKIIENFNKRIR